MNESWRVVLQGDALAALAKYRERKAQQAEEAAKDEEAYKMLGVWARHGAIVHPTVDALVRESLPDAE